MSDPLSISASIIAVLQLTASVVQYLNDMKDASKDRQRLLVEISSVSSLLYTLKDLAERAQWGDTWLATMKSLIVPNGPLEQFKVALEDLASRLLPGSGLRKVGNAMIWPFQKQEIRNILSDIERQKTLFAIALQNDHLELSRACREDMMKLRVGIADLQVGQKDQENRLRDQESRDIVAWLSPLKFSAKQNDIFSKRHVGTGQWFLENDIFKAWIDGHQKTLWCPRIPGAGKTVLASIIVDYLKQTFQEEDVGIACVYCSYKEQQEQTATNLMASLLQQLIQRRRTISNNVCNLYTRHVHTQTRPSLREWTDLLQHEVGSLSKVFVVIDALDECPENEGNRESLIAEIRKLQPSVHLLVTSRHIASIEREFENAARLEILANDEDVRRYLGGRIERGRLKLHVRADPALRDVIISTLVGKARGMFLLAQLHVDSLAKKPTRREVRLALKNLPKELDDTYHEALQRIWGQDEGDVKLARQVLSWTSFAIRPLTLDEVQHALAIEPGDIDVDEEALPEEDLLVSVCAGLVTHDRESNVIRLVHHTTQEYFERIRVGQFPDAQISIAATCLTYLSFDTLAGHCGSDEELKHRVQKYPLLHYAALHWGDHARGGPEESIQELILRFLGDDLKLLSSMQVTHIPKYQEEGYAQRFPRDVTALQVAASFGLGKITSVLLETGAQVAAEDSRGWTALHWAVEEGYKAVACLLLDAGAMVDAKAKNGGTALHRAAGRGHGPLVQLLLQAGPIVNMKTETGWTALHQGALGGHEAVVQLLLQAGSLIDAKTEDGGTALHWAAGVGHEAVVQLLLQAGAVVDIKAKDGWTVLRATGSRPQELHAKTENGGTALHWAAGSGHEGVVQLLLQAGGTVDAKTENGRTALQLAAEGEYEVVVQLLLQAGATVDAKDKDGWTALHWAAGGGHKAIVQLLLEAGAIVDTKNNDGSTALLIASLDGHEAIVQLLLQGGATVDAKHQGLTALYWAVGIGNKAMAVLLLQAGAAVDEKDEVGGTVLHQAAGSGHEAVVQSLLQAGAIVNTRANDGGSALHWAARSGHEAIVLLLLQAGGMIDSKTNIGGTALHQAAMRGHKSVVQLLLEKGANLSVASQAGWTPLHMASNGGHVDVVQLLLEKGADLAVTSQEGWTPLNAASDGGHVDVVQLLLEKGADLTVASRGGWTPLSSASESGHVDVVQLLLEKGADLTVASRGGWTPLISASTNGHVDVVKLLLEKGADVMVATQSGQNPLNLALSNGHIDVAKLLLENGAYLDVWGRESQYASQVAAFKGDYSLLQTLIENAKNLGIQGDIFEEELHLGCMQGHMTTIERLIDLGVSPDKADEHGWTPLLCASLFERRQILDYLLSKTGDRDLPSPVQPISPSSWSTVDKSTCLELDESLMCVRYNDETGTEEPPAALVLANHPIPLHPDSFYYEIEVLSSGETGEIGLGLCSKYTPLCAMPGWNDLSWGYHGDDGQKFSEGAGTPYSTGFKTGDVIGCCVHPKEGVSFTLNGAFLGIAFPDISGKLYPTVGMQSRGASVRVNFGQDVFVYNVDQAQRSRETKLRGRED